MSSLEALLEQHAKQDADNFELLRGELAGLRTDVRAATEAITRYRGFIGGVVFVVTALFAVVALVVSYVK